MKPTYEELLSQRDYFKNGMAELQDIIDKMQPEHDGLAAQVEVLRNHLGNARQTVGFLSHHLRGKLSDTALIELAGRADYWAGVLKDSPATCLAQVKADAGRAGFIEAAQIYSDWVTEGDYLPSADKYAERIRQEVV